MKHNFFKIPLFLAVFLFIACENSTETKGICGDSIVSSDTGEVCDENNLNGNSCQSLGFGGGVLTCSTACQFDTSACTTICGNGYVETTEPCDDANQENGDGCSNICEVEVGWACNEDSPSTCLPVCGDIMVVGNEECDGANLNETSCETIGFYAGNLVCMNDCIFDKSSCEASGRCGDSIIQTSYGEACDSIELNNETCMSRGFGSGTLACGSDCRFDESRCSMDVLSSFIGRLKHIPGGAFQRDLSQGNLSTVSPFKMSEFEITREQYLLIMGADPSDTLYSSSVSGPVQIVNWYRAISFCNKLSIAEGRTPVYSVQDVDFVSLTHEQIPIDSSINWELAVADWSADGYRLPTEMEWMWAAMGADSAAPGQVNTVGWQRDFAGSTGTNTITDYVWYGPNGSDTTHPVGMKLPNELGIYDISGNVWEWCWDYYGAIPPGALTDYRGAQNGDSRIARGGGSSTTDSQYIALDYRNYFYAFDRAWFLGLRVVRKSM